MAKDSVVTDYLEWKMKQGNLTFEVLKEKQTITVADFLKKDILRFMSTPCTHVLDEVNLELVTYYLPHCYDLSEEFKNWCAQFSHFVSWEDDILIIDYNTYGKYLFDCLPMLSNHLTGCAVDIRCIGIEQALHYAAILLDISDLNNEDYDELLIEQKAHTYWIHFVVKPCCNRRRTNFKR